MSTGIFFLLEAIIYIVLLMLVYFNKKRYKSEENKLYSFLIVFAFCELILELMLDLVGPLYETTTMVSYTISKIYCVFLSLWITTLFRYLVLVTIKMKSKDNYIPLIKKIYYIIISVSSILSLILPIYFNYESNLYYTYGPSVSVTYIIAFLASFVGVFCLIWNRENIKSRKYIPMLIFILLGGVCSLIQFKYPGLLLAVPVHAFITFLMYFTIENPDIELLEEVNKSKEISDNANEEKTLFLYNLTSEVKSTSLKINELTDYILKCDNIEDSKELAKDIKEELNNYSMYTNDLLNISATEVSDIKVYNSVYSTKTLIKELINIYSKECDKKGIKFISNIDHDLPESLYGDSINLKKVISTMLNNGVKYTTEGYLEFDVNTIIKKDICRLIITIEDSGIGIKSDELDKVTLNGSLKVAYKTLTLMGGTMIINSNYGSGTRIKIILDERIDNKVNEDIVKYKELNKSYKILFIDDSVASTKIINKIIKNTNIKLDISNNSKDALSKIKNKNEYDLILLDEEMNSIELLNRFKTVKGFNIPVVLMCKYNDNDYSDKYIDDGFSDYILKPLNKEKLISKINKILK